MTRPVGILVRGPFVGLGAAEAHLREGDLEIVHVETVSDSKDYPPCAEARA